MQGLDTKPAFLDRKAQHVPCEVNPSPSLMRVPKKVPKQLLESRQGGTQDNNMEEQKNWDGIENWPNKDNSIHHRESYELPSLKTSADRGL